MTDLISGHRLMSVIKPMVGIFAADDEFYISYNAVLNAIEYSPTIDSVPVVRCKDCKHRPIDTVGKGYGEDLSFDDGYKCPCRCEDPFYSWMPGDDWFCANGERREDD